MAGCALGTLLAIVFSLLDAADQRRRDRRATRTSSARAYPSAVGWLGLLFWLLAAYAGRPRPVAGGNGGRPDSAASCSLTGGNEQA